MQLVQAFVVNYTQAPSHLLLTHHSAWYLSRLLFSFCTLDIAWPYLARSICFIKQYMLIYIKDCHILWCDHIGAKHNHTIISAVVLTFFKHWTNVLVQQAGLNLSHRTDTRFY